MFYNKILAYYPICITLYYLQVLRVLKYIVSYNMYLLNKTQPIVLNGVFKFYDVFNFNIPDLYTNNNNFSF